MQLKVVFRILNYDLDGKKGNDLRMVVVIVPIYIIKRENKISKIV